MHRLHTCTSLCLENIRSKSPPKTLANNSIAKLLPHTACFNYNISGFRNSHVLTPCNNRDNQDKLAVTVHTHHHSSERIRPC